LSLLRYRTCPGCGTENPPTAADCENCGLDILGEQVENRSAAETPIIDIPVEVDTSPALRFESLASPGLGFTVREGQTIGRSDRADVVIEGVPELDSISRVMAKVNRRGDQWFIQHVATTNFIVVDGERYEDDDDVAIREGSVIGLALCQFIVRETGAVTA